MKEAAGLVLYEDWLRIHINRVCVLSSFILRFASWQEQSRQLEYVTSIVKNTIRTTENSELTNAFFEQKSTGGKAPRRVLRLEQLQRQIAANAQAHCRPSSHKPVFEENETAGASFVSPVELLPSYLNDCEVDLEAEDKSEQSVAVSPEIQKQIIELEKLYASGFLQSFEFEERRKQILDTTPTPSLVNERTDAFGGWKLEDESEMFVGFSKRKTQRNSKSTGKDRNVRIFLSSTFRDMTAEREHLIKHTMPQLRKFCESRGVTLTEVTILLEFTLSKLK